MKNNEIKEGIRMVLGIGFKTARRWVRAFASGTLNLKIDEMCIRMKNLPTMFMD